jgi:hypothetical protein
VSRSPKYIRKRREQWKNKGQPAKEGQLSLAAIPRTWRIIGAVLSGTCVLLGLLTGVLTLLPRLSVSNLEALNPADPFTTPFVVSNDGYLGVNNVRFSCLLYSLLNEKQHIVMRGGAESINYASPVRRLPAGERATIPCYPFMKTARTPSRIDIAVNVTYRPDYVPWSKADHYRFVATDGSDGKLHWLPQPYIPIGKVPTFSYSPTSRD